MANKRFEILEHGSPVWLVGNKIFYSLWDGFVVRDNKQFPEREILDQGDVVKRGLEDLRDVAIFPFILAKDIFNQGRHFFKPYENKEQVKKDALLFKSQLIALGKLLLATLVAGLILAFYPLILLIALPLYLTKFPPIAALNKKAKALIVLVALLAPVLLVPILALSLVKAALPVVLFPLNYLGMLWRGFMTLVRKIFPPAPIEETNAFQSKVAAINDLLPALQEAAPVVDAEAPTNDDEMDAVPVTHIMSPRDCATLITLVREMHAQYHHFTTVKHRTSLIESGMEKALFNAVLRAYPAALATQLKGNGFAYTVPTVNVSQELLVAIRDYAAIYNSGTMAKEAVEKHKGFHKFFNLVINARGHEKVRPYAPTAALRPQVIEDVLAPAVLGANPVDEMKRQAFLSRIAEKADKHEYKLSPAEEMMIIPAVDGHKISVPKAVAQIQRRLMLVEDPEQALAQARGHKEYGRFFQRVVATPAPQSTLSVTSQRSVVSL